jgi:anti-sigma-K factor RskA
MLMIPSAQLVDLFSSRWEANDADPTHTLVLERRLFFKKKQLRNTDRETQSSQSRSRFVSLALSFICLYITMASAIAVDASPLPWFVYSLTTNA